jgi:alkylation response protein AidB-like acyl-CoA dehydrogenase
VDFAESAEHRALRAAAAEIARDFGPRYYAERAAERRPCAELWKALGEAAQHSLGLPRSC